MEWNLPELVENSTNRGVAEFFSGMTNGIRKQVEAEEAAAKAEEEAADKKALEDAQKAADKEAKAEADGTD